ncbi:hypothetical protein F4859DRAFT_491319 [Xylaria cf. heliscus]|nr:hypothetical protein F4859DRAFT_491319 [Xylaria cf. heliscus]
MLSSLENLINDIALYPENRKVKQYLDKATRDSVSSDLGKVLLPHPKTFKERELIQVTFDKYCIRDSSSCQKYWTEESFRNHVRDTYSAAAISDAAVVLLWRSFYFYAYHPFSPDHYQHAKIDFNAFRRATLLTVFQCDGLLGTRELEWYWRQDAAFFRRAGFTRIFRSIAVSDYTSLKEQQIDMTSSLSDAMDVLVMIGPQFIHAAPSEPQLESVARKLFAEGPPVVQRQVVEREDVSALMQLLLRLRLREERWGACYHFGDLVEAGSGEEDFAKVLVDTLTGDRNEQIVTFQELSGVIDLMPNLLLRFQQLWSVLFQPQRATAMTQLQLGEVGLTSIIGGVVSLFAPHIDLDSADHQRTDKQDTRLTLEAVSQVSSDSQDTSMFHLSRCISDQSSAYVVLFTTGVDTSKTIIGAYLPIPSKATHILFQLQPKFRLLWWTKRKVSRADLIKADGKISLPEFAGNELPEPAKNTPYWIGNPLELGSGIRVDPEKETATLINTVGGCYTETLAVDEEGNPGTSWTVTAQQARMDIFTVAVTGHNES